MINSTRSKLNICTCCVVGILVTTLFAACTPGQLVTSSPSPPTEETIIDIRSGLPTFPGAVEDEGDVTSYHYTIKDVDIDAVQHFYADEMQASGWELLGKGDVGGTDIGKAYVLWFVKGQDIISVDIFIKENLVHVMITMSN